MKVLVTGASGFLGAHVVWALLKKGVNVVAAHRHGSNTWRLDTFEKSLNGLIFETVDLASKNTIDYATHKHKPDVIVNCAAYGVDYRQQNCDEAIQSNITAVSWLVDAAKKNGVSRFIQIGTCYEYGNHTAAITEDACLYPQGVYSVTKASGTLLALDRARSIDLPIVVLRPFGMYGPLEGEHKFVPMLLKTCAQNGKLDLTEGEQLRDYLYVEDAATAIVAIVEVADFPNGEIFNIASGLPLTLRDFGEAAKSVAGQGKLSWGAKPYRSNEMMSVIANIDKLKAFVGWQPSVSLEKGLSLTLKEIESREEII